jgi:hypothetical protein
MRNFITIVENYNKSFEQLATKAETLEQFIRSTDGMDVLYRGHYDSKVPNNSFMSDYVGHAAEYIDDTGRVDAFAYNESDVLYFNDQNFEAMRKYYAQFSPKRIYEIYKEELQDNRFSDELDDRKQFLKILRILKSDRPFAQYSQNFEITNYLIPLMQHYADHLGKNIVGFLGGDYGEYGGQNEFVVRDISKLQDLSVLYKKLKG